MTLNPSLSLYPPFTALASSTPVV
ncbi:hypothetical protein BCEP4_1130037 [Burkholderia cepacia]|nr:hypothetical protein BCEP4_1130037 [Burkholderia cepacia]